MRGTLPNGTGGVLMNKTSFRFLFLILILTLTFAASIGCNPSAPQQTPSTTVSIPEGEPDPAVWGKVYPAEYASWQKQSEMIKGNSKYGGSIPESYLKDSPVQIKLFAGYPFSEDYNKRRGHVYALVDVLKTKRIGPKSTASCWNCKSPNVPPLINQMGDSFWSTPFTQLESKIKHPIACADCHDSKTMALKITRVTLLDALKLRGVDPTKLSRQEMRTMVCAQCHVEYYFDPKTKKVKYPWKYGLAMDDEEKYYDEINFKDWEHPQTKAPMLKAQHPDYETWSTGVHAANGVSCADCHMPLVTYGQGKITSHDMQSPLNSITDSCKGCHTQSEQYLKDQVIGTQDKVFQTKRSLENALSDAIDAITNASKNPSAKTDLMNDAKTLHRKAQWRWDWVSAGNGMGIHSPDECLRVLADGITLARQAQLKANLAVGGLAGGTGGPTTAGGTSTSGTAVDAHGPGGNPETPSTPPGAPGNQTPTTK